MLTIVILGVICTYVFYVIYISMVKPKNFPPGPIGLPIIGSFHWIAPEFHSKIPKLAKKYGNIFGVKASIDNAVCIVGYDMIKEVITDRAKEFSDRGNFTLTTIARSNKSPGIAAANYGSSWLTHRKFFFTALRNMGMNKRGIEARIKDELPALIQEIENQSVQHEAIDPAIVLEFATLNVIASFAFGDRYAYEDQKLKTLLKVNKEITYSTREAFSISTVLLRLIPGLHHYWIPKGFKKLQSLLAQIRQFTRNEIEHHQNTLDHENPRDFIDYYLLEMKKESNVDYSLERLATNLIEFFRAGTETSSSTLGWAIIYMVNNPDVQEKVHEEIDRVLGLDKEPTYDDRLSMPYCEAAILETQRKATVAPIGLMHAPNKDTEIRGYKVPKGTMIIPSYHSIHYSPEHWKNPENFDPNNFLDDDGKVGTRNAFMPFGGGLRICAGMNFAKQELFIFFVGILQKFKISSPEGCTKLSEDFFPANGIVPKPFKAVFQRRY